MLGARAGGLCRPPARTPHDGRFGREPPAVPAEGRLDTLRAPPCAAPFWADLGPRAGDEPPFARVTPPLVVPAAAPRAADLRAVPRTLAPRVLLPVAGLRVLPLVDDGRFAVLRVVVAARLVVARLVVARLAVLRVASVDVRALLLGLLPAFLRAPPARGLSPLRADEVPPLTSDVPLRAPPERDEEAAVSRAADRRVDELLPDAAPSAEAAVDWERRRAAPDIGVLALPVPPRGRTPFVEVLSAGVLSLENLERVAIRKLLVAGVPAHRARIRHVLVLRTHRCEKGHVAPPNAKVPR